MNYKEQNPVSCTGFIFKPANEKRSGVVFLYVYNMELSDGDRSELRSAFTSVLNKMMLENDFNNDQLVSRVLQDEECMKILKKYKDSEFNVENLVVESTQNECMEYDVMLENRDILCSVAMNMEEVA